MRLGRRTALAAALVLAALGAPAAAAPVVAGTVVSPTDAATVEDPDQVTGRRLAAEPCDDAVSACHEAVLLGQLDGFDLDPVVTVRLEAVPPQVDPSWTWIEPVGGGTRIELDRLVIDVNGPTLTGRPSRMLQEATTYRAVFAPPGVAPSSTTFTTMSVTPALAALRDQLEGPAYQALGIPEAERGITLAETGAGPAVFDASALAGLSRRVDVGTGLRTEPLFDLTDRRGSLALGSFPAPRWLGPDRVFAAAPSGGPGPPTLGVEQVGVLMVVPEGPAPETGWPVAIFAPGLTRSRYDVLLAAGRNAGEGLATVALDPAGHGGGPGSALEVRPVDGAPVVVAAPGRGVDVNGDGAIGPSEGVSAPSQPHPAAGVGLRDGLRQSAADVMALTRALGRGLDVDGDGRSDLDGSRVRLLGHSLGAMYGALAVAVDDRLEIGVLNAVGGPITEIARLAPGTRPVVAAELSARVPPLAAEDLESVVPAAGEPPRREEDPAAADVRAALARLRHLQRAGGAEAVAPRLAGRVVLQLAVGDRTVPNPTSLNVVRAGGLADATTTYRHDLAAGAGRDPHGFLLDPTQPGSSGAQDQARTLLSEPSMASGGLPDPDGDAPLFEVGVAALEAPVEAAPGDPGTGPATAPGAEPEPVPGSVPAAPSDAGRRAVLSVVGLVAVTAATAGALRWARERRLASRRG